MFLSLSDDIWVSPSEDAQTCLENVKSLCLDPLWKACCCVTGENASDLHKHLQRFDFNVLGRVIPIEWRFGEFLMWLHVSAWLETMLFIGLEYFIPGTEFFVSGAIKLPEYLQRL
jgi:hypothetical protein